MSDDEDNKNKPDLKVVSLEDKREELDAKTEFEDLDFNSKAVQAYALSRAVFSEIEDPFLEEEAVSLLRKAFLLALNPLRQVDEQFDIFDLGLDDD